MMSMIKPKHISLPAFSILRTMTCISLGHSASSTQKTVLHTKKACRTRSTNSSQEKGNLLSIKFSQEIKPGQYCKQQLILFSDPLIFAMRGFFCEKYSVCNHSGSKFTKY